MAVADLPDAADDGGVMEPHATGPLHDRLDDDGGRSVRHHVLEGFEVIANLCLARSRNRRRRGEVLLGEDAAPQGVHPAVRIAHAHRRERVAVIAGAPGKEGIALRVAAPALVLQRHFECYLDAHGTGVGVEDLVVNVAGELEEVAGEPRGRFMGKPAEHNVAHRIDLLLCRFH